MRLVIALSLLVSVVAAPAAAQSEAQVSILGTENLRTVCSDNSNGYSAGLNSGFCIGFVRAVFERMFVEGVILHDQDARLPDPGKCLPSYITNEFLVMIVKDRLKAQPEERGFAFDFVERTFKNSFPSCLIR